MVSLQEFGLPQTDEGVEVPMLEVLQLFNLYVDSSPNCIPTSGDVPATSGGVSVTSDFVPNEFCRGPQPMDISCTYDEGDSEHRQGVRRCPDTC